MRTFYEEWRAFDSNLADASAKGPEENALIPMALPSVPIAAFFSIGFSHHTLILSKVKTAEERNYYIQLCADMLLSYDALEHKIAENADAHRGQMPNNFSWTIDIVIG